MKTFTALFVGSLVSSAFAQLQPCNLAQVAGTSELFTISGGDGIFPPNSTQEILWDRPSGAPVRRIRANITIFDTVLETVYTPLDITGVPVEFPPEESELAKNGTISVRLPEIIPEGDDYVFRVTIRSRGALCYLDTMNFTIAAVVEPPVDCTPGNMICTDDLSGFQQCVETDETATSFEFGTVISCAATTVCNQVTVSTVSCTTPPVVDLCTLGDFECVAEIDASRECILSAETNTTVWGEPIACLEGFSCNSTTGICEADPPVDECTLGTSECVTETSNRQCVLDEETGVTVWTPAADCPPGTTCNAETGLCTSGTPSTGCTPHTQVCLSTTEYDECIHNQDGFWSFGGVTLNCPDGSVCTPYINNTINCIPTTIEPVRRRNLRFRRRV